MTEPKQPDPPVQEEATVTVRFGGTKADGDDDSLRIGKFVLPLGVDTEVPPEVAETLTTGENAKLYKIAKVA